VNRKIYFLQNLSGLYQLIKSYKLFYSEDDQLSFKTFSFFRVFLSFLHFSNEPSQSQDFGYLEEKIIKTCLWLEIIKKYTQEKNALCIVTM
jgi:hypothetical protein